MEKRTTPVYQGVGKNSKPGVGDADGQPGPGAKADSD